MVNVLETMSFDSLSFQQVLLILVSFITAYILHRLSGRIAGRIVYVKRFASATHRTTAERRITLRTLISNVISFIVFAGALLFSLGLFVGPTTLVWIVGLFSAAFGLGARPLVSDFLSGVSFIFEDTFSVGDKVEMIIPGSTVEGVIEAVHLRITLVRSTTGELYTVPNGEVRVVRNFSRGHFSRADITLRLATGDLQRALPVLEALGEEAVSLLPNLLESWQIISASDEAGQHTELTLISKARFGKAAEMRPRLLALVQERLLESDIHLAE